MHLFIFVIMIMSLIYAYAYVNLLIIFQLYKNWYEWMYSKWFYVNIFWLFSIYIYFKKN